MKKLPIYEHNWTIGVMPEEIETLAEKTALMTLSWDKDAFKWIWQDFYVNGPGCN